MSLPRITVAGRLADDPQLKFTQAGKAVCRLRIVASDRVKVGDEWKDGDTLWISATCWERLAENVAESTKKGDLVIVTGRLLTEEWTDRESNKRSAITLKVESLGADLAFRVLPHGGAAHAAAATDRGIPEQTPTDDPWATPATTPGSAEPGF
jgi:single-strand DNA-binding protein